MFKEFWNEEPDSLRARVEGAVLPDSIYSLLVETRRRYYHCQAWEFIDSGISRTWGEVLHLVDRTAAAFHAIGIEEGSHVAIMASNVEEFPLTWLALAKLGAVMVPVNCRYTTRELDYVLKTSQATFLIIETDLVQIAEDLEKKAFPDKNIVVIGGTRHGYRSWDEMMDRFGDGDMPAATPDPDRLMNLQYTSGTTGFPKGCMLSHRYWLLLGYTSLEMFGTTIRRFYSGLSFFYMVPQRILMNAMFAGGCIVVPRKPSAKRFMEDVRRSGSEYALLLGAIMKEPRHPQDSKHKLKIVSGGLGSTDEQEEFHERFQVSCQSFYGMTEIGCGSYVPAHRITETAGSKTIGVPLPFREFCITDDHGNALGVGERGELCVRGPGILQGYYGMDEATAKSFRGEWFRTGDLCYRDENGYYFLVGRLKDVVRRGGENIAAREVEAVLRGLEAVREVAVVPVPDRHVGEEVKAYIQLKEGLTPEELPPHVIYEYCSKNLAPFKVPRFIEYYGDFPLTDSSRVQKRKLIEEKPDLRVGSYDRLKKQWHQEQV